MLPLADKPTLQYIVDEAVASGITNITIVTSRSKRAIEDHFDQQPELRAALERKGDTEKLAMLERIETMASICFVRQQEPKGLGHAVLMAKSTIGNEPFGVMLPDDLIWNGAGKGALRQMAEVGEREGAGVIAVEEVPREQTDKYGIVDAAPVDERSARIRHMVEKPKPAEAPSNLAVVGRYVLPGRIFELLERTTPGAGGEIQLTDAIDALLKEQGKVLAYRFEGTRFDCGNKAGLVRATMHMALQDPGLAPVVREIAATL